jgi:hypothetical protein
MLVAGILLIIIFILIAISYNNSNSKAEWPPLMNNCPDYFIDINGDGSSCYNSKSLGKDVGNYIDFKDNYPTSCDKYTFCNTNLLTWDGITYGYGKKNPCDTSS